VARLSESIISSGRLVKTACFISVPLYTIYFPALDELVVSDTLGVEECFLKDEEQTTHIQNEIHNQ
jgi:hypothetical protein